MRHGPFNGLTIPRTVVRHAAAEATLDARNAMRDAERELSRPRVTRRPTAAIHGGVLRLTALATRLARAA